MAWLGHIYAMAASWHHSPWWLPDVLPRALLCVLQFPLTSPKYESRSFGYISLVLGGNEYVNVCAYGPMHVSLHHAQCSWHWLWVHCRERMKERLHHRVIYTILKHLDICSVVHSGILMCNLLNVFDIIINYKKYVWFRSYSSPGTYGPNLVSSHPTGQTSYLTAECTLSVSFPLIYSLVFLF